MIFQMTHVALPMAWLHTTFGQHFDSFFSILVGHTFLFILAVGLSQLCQRQDTKDSTSNHPLEVAGESSRPSIQ